MAAGEKPFTPIVGADGKATVTIKVDNGLDRWTVTQVSLELPAAPSGATCYVRKNGYPISPAVPTGDTVAGDPPVILDPADKLTVEWAGCTPGIAGKVLVFYDDGRP
jgi:hypothetical protein